MIPISWLRDPHTLSPREPGTRAIYFVRSGCDGDVKIGVATDLPRRLESLQVGNPAELLFLGLIESPKRDAFALESRIHATFAPLRRRGEWFSPHEALLSAIEALNFDEDIDRVLSDARESLARKGLS